MKRLLAAAAALCFAAGAAAQQIPDCETITRGRLPNGLTYYVAHNANPAGCAEFYIVHNVGAMQEEDNQNGLAHFLEHMAFNGTRHYPDKGILEFLSREGVRFGYNVNAYTSRNETVYNISKVPLVRDSFVDSVLMVLRDWSCDISCNQDDLDDERGVISEEWRLKDNSRNRMSQRQIELIYKGGLQPRRSVVGTLEVINGFKREEILDFYRKWYRPDLQAIIVVGDFDVERMESRIRAIFSDIPAAENPAAKADRSLPPEQTSPLYCNMTDPEIKYKALKVLYKQPYPEFAQRKDMEAFRDYYSRLVVSSVLGERLKECQKQSGCPAQSAVCVTSDYSPEFYITMITVTPRRDDALGDCLAMVVREKERLLRYGISAAELEAAKLSVLQRARLDYEMAESDVTGERIVKRCQDNFLRGWPLAGPREYADIQREAIASITQETIAGYPQKMFDERGAIYSNCCNSAAVGEVPDYSQMRDIVAGVCTEELQSRFIEYPALDLSVQMGEGRILSEKKLDKEGLRLWKLSNGLKVYYLQSAPVRSGVHLAMDLTFESGYRAFACEGIARDKEAASYIRRAAGFRGCDRSELLSRAELAGVSGSVSIRENEARISLTAFGGKEETAFRALALQLREPCFGSVAELDKSREARLRQLSKPASAAEKFARERRNLYNGGHPWNAEADSASVAALDMGVVERLYAAEFSGADRAALYICSDADPDTIASLVCRYAATLDLGRGGRLSGIKPRTQAYSGREILCRSISPAPSAPLCDVCCIFSGNIEKTARDIAAVEILDHIMSMRYLNLIREKRGGTYHIDFDTRMYPGQKHRSTESYVEFQTRPEMKDLLVSDVEREMERFCADGPTAEEVAVAVKYLKKHRREQDALSEASITARLREMEDYVKDGVDYGYDYAAVLDGIDAACIKEIGRRLNSGSRFITVYTEVD